MKNLVDIATDLCNLLNKSGFRGQPMRCYVENVGSGEVRTNPNLYTIFVLEPVGSRVDENMDKNLLALVKMIFGRGVTVSHYPHCNEFEVVRG